MTSPAAALLLPASAPPPPARRGTRLPAPAPSVRRDLPTPASAFLLSPHPTTPVPLPAHPTHRAIRELRSPR